MTYFARAAGSLHHGSDHRRDAPPQSRR